MLIIGRKGSVGEVTYAPNGGWPIDTTFCVFPKDDRCVDLRYLFFLLRRMRLNRLTITTSIPGLNRDDLESVRIPLPDIHEQRRIAAILDKADAIRRKHEQALALADDFLRSTFLHMFGDPVTNPKGWPSMPFGQIMASDPQNGLYRPSQDYGRGTPILRIDSFYDGYLLEEISFKRVDIDAETAQKYGLHQNDIVINRVNSPKFLGKSALIEGLHERSVFESNMMRVSVNNNIVNPRFIVDQLQMPYVKQQIQTKSRDSVNQSSINQDDVKSIELRVPPNYLQQDYASLVCRTAKSKKRLGNAKRQAEVVFASLSQRAFRGEL